MAKIWKKKSEISKDRWSGFWAGDLLSFFSVIVPLMAGALTQRMEAVFLIPTSIGGICAIRVKKDKVLFRYFGPDGNLVPEDLPEDQLRSMGLLKKEAIWLKEYSISDESGFPSIIAALPEQTNA